MTALDQLLRETSFNEDERQFIVNSFEHGFPTGYDGDKNVQMKAPNLRLECGTESDLWEKVMKEVKLGRFAGPFKEVPFDTYIESPIGPCAQGRQ